MEELYIRWGLIFAVAHIADTRQSWTERIVLDARYTEIVHLEV